VREHGRLDSTKVLEWRSRNFWDPVWMFGGMGREGEMGGHYKQIHVSMLRYATRTLGITLPAGI